MKWVINNRFAKTFLFGLVMLPGLVSPTLGQETPALVGRVLDIDGPRLYTDKLKESSWYQAYAGMDTFLRERLRTDKETQAVLEFAVGGRAGMSRNTEVRIVSNQRVEKQGTGNALRLNSGNFWAKFDKQEEEFEIQTSGGVIGIEGTELLIGVDEETGVTEVLLFEGQVSVIDKKGSKKTLFPGDYVEFGGPKGMCVLSYPSASLRTLIVERYPKFSSFLAAQKITSIPNPASPTLVRGANKSRADLLTVLSQALLKTEGARPSGVYLDPSAQGAPPSFRWDGVNGADSYAFYLSSDAQVDDLVFTSRCSEPRFSVPEGAQGIGQGRYYWTVVALDENGQPMGPGTQSNFETAGWSAQGVELE